METQWWIPPLAILLQWNFLRYWRALLVDVGCRFSLFVLSRLHSNAFRTGFSLIYFGYLSRTGWIFDRTCTTGRSEAFGKPSLSTTWSFTPRRLVSVTRMWTHPFANGITHRMGGRTRSMGWSKQRIPGRCATFRSGAPSIPGASQCVEAAVAAIIHGIKRDDTGFWTLLNDLLFILVGLFDWTSHLKWDSLSKVW